MGRLWIPLTGLTLPLLSQNRTYDFCCLKLLSFQFSPCLMSVMGVKAGIYVKGVNIWKTMSHVPSGPRASPSGDKAPNKLLRVETVEEVNGHKEKSIVRFSNRRLAANPQSFFRDTQGVLPPDSTHLP